MDAEDSLEEKRLTGTETSPKEIVAEAMDLGAMGRLVRGRFIYRQDPNPRKKGAGWRQSETKV
jgi:hypothetical protein